MRTLVWIVVALVLGAGGWFLFFHEDDDATLPPFVPVDLPFATEGVDAAGPGLQGSGTRGAAGPTANAGRFVLRGRVVDEGGAPMPGVPVVALRTSQPRSAGRRGDWNLPVDETIARMRARAVRTTPPEHPEVARTTSDAEGRFALRVGEYASYHVRAAVAPPKVSTQWQPVVHGLGEVGEGVLQVLDGSALHGTVVDDAGAAMDAVVVADFSGTVEGAYRAWTADPVETAAGAWRVPAVPAGEGSLTAWLPDGRRVRSVAVTAPHEGAIEIRVPGGGSRIEGTVADADGAPVADALLTVHVGRADEGAPAMGRLTLQARSAADGRFSLPGLPAGRVHWVEAAATGFLPYRKAPAAGTPEDVVLGEAGTATLEVVLERGGIVTGRVRTLDGGAPIAGATVELRNEHGRTGLVQLRSEAPTDAEGRYRIRYVPPGTWVAFAEAAGHYLPEIAAPRPAGGVPSNTRRPPESLLVVMTGEGREITRDLTLGRGYEVSGVVLGPDGRPIAGADVRARAFGLSQHAWQWGLQMGADDPIATTAADGTFVARGLPPREDWVLYGQQEGLVAEFSKPFALGPGKTPPSLTLRLAGGATIRGKVEGLAPEEISQAQVGYWGEGSERAGRTYNHKLADDGSFEITGVPPGTWRLNLWAGGRQGGQQVVEALKAGEVREGVVFTVSEGVAVSGVVLDPEGRPVPRLSIMLQSTAGGGWSQTSTDAEGRFRFPSAPRGTAKVMTWTAGRQVPLGETFEAPAEGLEFTYVKPRTVTLRGEVVATDGSTLGICTVRLGSAPQDFGMPDAGTVTAVEGRFEIRAQGDGPWKLTASDPRDADGKPLNLREGRAMVVDPAQPVVIRLEPGTRVSGRVLGPAGKPLAGVIVAIGRANTQTDAQGRFSLDGLPDGEHTLRVSPPKGLVAPAPKRVRADTEGVEFRLIAGVSISGRAFDPEGKPLSSGFAAARWEAMGGHPAGGASSQIRDDGRFELEGIPEGIRATVQVQLFNADGGVAYAPAVLENVQAGATDLELRLGGGLSIRGRVLDAKGKPPGICFVYGRTEDGKRQTGWVRVDDEGRFELAGLRDEPYILQLQRQDGGVAPPTQKVTPPAADVVFRLPVAAVVAGRVEGLSGAAVNGWMVLAWTPDGQRLGQKSLQSGGDFRFDRVAAGSEVVIGVSKQGEARFARTGPVRAGREDLVLQLETGHGIAGTVEGAVEDGRTVAVVWAQGADGWMGRGVVTPEGRFSIPGLPPGRYTVHAMRTGGEQRTQVEGIEAGATGVRLELR